MTAAEAQAFADQGSDWGRWVSVADALRDIEFRLEVSRKMPSNDDASLYGITFSEGWLDFDEDTTEYTVYVKRRRGERGHHAHRLASPGQRHRERRGSGKRGCPEQGRQRHSHRGDRAGRGNDASLRSHGVPGATNDYSAFIEQMKEWRNNPQWSSHWRHRYRWDRALLAFGEPAGEAWPNPPTPLTSAEAQSFADRGSAWGRWVSVADALRDIEFSRQEREEQDRRQHTPPSPDDTDSPNTDPGGQDPPNRAPTVSSAIADVTIVRESGTRQVSLSGVFSDADSDSLTISASSSDETKATVSVASDNSSLTVTAKSRGTATITVTANDGSGGTVDDDFTVTVKAAPTVASAISDVSGLEVGATQEVSLSGVFSDADGDTLTITASSSDDTKSTVAVASDYSKLTVAGVSVGTATVTVTAQDSDGNSVRDAFDTTVVAAPQQQQANRAPTVSSAIADVTIVRESGTRQVSLSGVFSDADSDSLTISASSSDETKATVSVASDNSSLTVTAKSRGTATITVTADDGNGGTVEDAFTVRVKATPTVASSLADVSGLEVGATQEVSLSGVFSDADGDSLTFTAASSDDTKATVAVASDYSSLTVAGVAVGTATITVTAQDSDNNSVSDAFAVSVSSVPEPDPTPTPTPEPPQSTLTGTAALYDANGDGKIDYREWGRAKRDFGAGKITYAQLEEVRSAYDPSLRP